MRIGFDRQTFIMQRYGGISRYFSDLYLGLLEQPEIEADLLFRHHQNAYLSAHGIGKKINPLTAKCYIKTMMSANFRLPLARGKDIHHSTYYLGMPKKVDERVKLVSTLYDMIPELFPMFFNKTPHANKHSWFNASDLIISISDSSADDLVFFQPQLSDRIHRIHLYAGFSEDSFQSKPKGLINDHKPYIMFVGSRRAYKNAAMLTRAFAASEPNRHGQKLLFAGGGAFNNEELTDIARLGITDYVQQLNVNDAELWYLYKNALAVIVPSMAEGFSLPLVEGLAADIPIICSDIPVHREVANRFATLINPIHHEDWTDILKGTTEMISPSCMLGKDLYKERCRYFSKERMVNEHIAAYSAIF